MKEIPFSSDAIRALCKTFPTPVYVYDERAIRENARALLRAFAWAPGFKNYFAVKATPTPAILSLLHEEGMGFDCSSFSELVLAEKLAVTGDDLMFTSNNTPAQDMQKAFDINAIINLDDISHIDFLDTVCDMNRMHDRPLCMRYNPGSLKTGNDIIGKPEEAKYGFTRSDIFEGFQKAQHLGIKHFGLHIMVVSNELDAAYFVETAELMFSLAVEIKQKLGISVQFINLGGGIGIPYEPHQQAVDYQKISDGIHRAYQSILIPAGLDGLEIKMENGRAITGPYGYLLSSVIHTKNTYKHYIGLDACMADLMRPGMYGAYHHISVLDKDEHRTLETYDVVGSLCENNDKFAIDRQLPQLHVGDIICIHDAGAHGHAMGFNYNGKLRSAEVLVRENGDVKLIRRSQTLDDYFSTLLWN